MKGSRVTLFKIGERIKYVTNIGNKVFKRGKDKDGNKIETFSHKVDIIREDFGRIGKLHMSGTHGVAEIFPDGGGKKLARRLQHVFKVA